MRPHRLEVTAFGAFAGTSSVCFDDLEGLFLLHGETGAGKTTLLDAIAFALYGRVPGERGKARRLRSDHASARTRTEVRLEATISGRRLRITRSPEQDRPKKAGKGSTTERARVLLEECRPDGTWQTKSTRIDEASAEIADLMGMSAEQFFQVVLLPQGQFAQFLHSDAETRRALLQRLFGTDRFRAVEEWLAERRRSTAAGVEAARGSVDLLTAQVAQAAGVPVPDGPPSGLASGSQEPGPADSGTSPAALLGNMPAGPGALKQGDSPAAEPLNLPGDNLSAAPRTLSTSASERDSREDGFWQRPWAVGLAKAADTERDAAVALAGERSRDLEAALETERVARLLADKQRRRADVLRRGDELRLAEPDITLLRGGLDAAARAAEVAPLLTESSRAETAAAAARTAEEAARAAIPDVGPVPGGPVPGGPVPGGPVSGGPVAEDAAALRSAGVAGLRAAARERQQHLGRLEALRSVARQAAEEDEAAEASRTRACRLSEVLDVGRAETAWLGERRWQSVAARDAASHAAAVLPAARAEAERHRRGANDSAELAKAHARRDGLHQAHLTARETAVALREEAQRLRESRFDGMRAELAATLADGTPCPVCGSLDHPDLCELRGERVSREQEEQATADADDAAGKADQAGQRLAAADALIGELVQRLAGDGFGASDAAPAADRAHLEAEADRMEAEAARLEADADRIASVAAELGERQAGLDAIEKAIATAAKHEAELTEQRAAAEDEAEGALRRAAGHRESLLGELGGAADLDSALTAASGLAEALAAAADAADETARAAAEAREAGERAALAAADAGFTDTEAAREALRDPGWRHEAADQIAQHEAEAKAIAGLLADPDLAVPLEPPAAVADAAEAVAAAREAHEAAVGAQGRAQHTAVQLADLVPKLDDALTALEPLIARATEARRLADLAAGGGANTLRMTLSSFVLAARLEEVAAAASQRLLTMTAGRYSLVHTDTRRGGGRAGLGLLACDSWTGLDRDTSTLSGGETFLASLALALGLADVVTAEAAGTPMEALFVDEGFGTLDEETLEEVMNVLDGLREGGRIVGIVSHVTELRQRIPAQVHVLKGHHGSRVSVTPG